jgi:hypothetical protein
MKMHYAGPLQSAEEQRVKGYPTVRRLGYSKGKEFVSLYSRSCIWSSAVKKCLNIQNKKEIRLFGSYMSVFILGESILLCM